MSIFKLLFVKNTSANRRGIAVILLLLPVAGSFPVHAAEHADVPLGDLAGLLQNVDTIALNDFIPVPKGEKKVKLDGGEWNCTVYMNEKDPLNNRRITPRQIDLVSFSIQPIDRDGPESDYNDRWRWNAPPKKLAPLLVLKLRDKTIKEIHCVGAPGQTNMDDLEDAIRPFDLGIKVQDPQDKPPVDA